VVRTADITTANLSLPVTVSSVFNNFEGYFYISTVRRQNSWLALTEPSGSAENRLKTCVREYVFTFFFIFKNMTSKCKKSSKVYS